MVKTGLSFVLVATLTLQLLADDRCEKEKPARPNVVPVSVLLERLAKSPLGTGEANLLNAVSNLIEKEQAAGSRNSAMASPSPILASKPAQTSPAAMAGPIEQPARLWIRLQNSPAADVGKAVEQFFDRESMEGGNRRGRDAQSPIRPVLVCDPISNSLLVSVTPRYADELAEIISQLDARPTTVALNVCIARLLPRSRGGEAGHGLGDGTDDKAPSMKEDGRGVAHMGEETRPPRSPPTAASNDPRQSDGHYPSGIRCADEQAQVGYGCSSCAFRANGTRVVYQSHSSCLARKLDFRRSRGQTQVSVVDVGDAAGRTTRRTSFQTTVSGKSGQTLVVKGPMEHADGGEQETIVAITPQINPTKR